MIIAIASLLIEKIVL